MSQPTIVADDPFGELAPVQTAWSGARQAQVGAGPRSGYPPGVMSQGDDNAAEFAGTGAAGPRSGLMESEQEEYLR